MGMAQDSDEIQANLGSAYILPFTAFFRRNSASEEPNYSQGMEIQDQGSMN